jgi:hypothetical protein
MTPVLEHLLIKLGFKFKFQHHPKTSKQMKIRNKALTTTTKQKYIQSGNHVAQSNWHIELNFKVSEGYLGIHCTRLLNFLVVYNSQKKNVRKNNTNRSV